MKKPKTLSQGFIRKWYSRGAAAGRSGKYASAFEAIPASAPTMAQQFFYNGFKDHFTGLRKKSNPSKRAKQRRMATALKKFLATQNPGRKYAGAFIHKLKGGAFRVVPFSRGRN